MAQDILPSFDSTVGDINVKISAILQGRNEISAAIEHLLKAKQIYEESIQMKTILGEDERKEILIEKIIEVLTGIANLQVNAGEIDNASDQYKVRLFLLTFFINNLDMDIELTSCVNDFHRM